MLSTLSRQKKWRKQTGRQVSFVNFSQPGRTDYKHVPSLYKKKKIKREARIKVMVLQKVTWFKTESSEDLLHTLSLHSSEKQVLLGMKQNEDTQ